ncbi:hypothetical protein AB0P15_11310 [Streptomyces sp. NPDC087917]|uniref:hypothetical protein n=1 Tax=unclassified Streptomyces TaxID=2593676 RepID=UPI003439F2C9
MSDSFPPSSEKPGDAPERRGLRRVVPRSRGARWTALGAAVVIVGGGLAAVAVAEHHDGHDGRRAVMARADGGPFGGAKRAQGAEPKVRDHDGGERGGPGGRPGGGGKAEGGRSGGGKAPAPVPSLPIAQAAEKAAGAVPDGKVEALRAIAQEGGGSAWLAVVLGPDGVRHRVTVAGTDGAITSNTVAPGAR